MKTVKNKHNYDENALYAWHLFFFSKNTVVIMIIITWINALSSCLYHPIPTLPIPTEMKELRTEKYNGEMRKY